MKRTRKLLSLVLVCLLVLTCFSGLTVAAKEQNVSRETVVSESVVTGKPVDLVFIIDSTSSMSSYINSVKSNLTSFVKYLHGKGVDLRMSVIDYKDIIEDGSDSTHIHIIDGNNWSSDVDKIINAFSNISTSGGGDFPETPTDALNKITNSEYGWRENAQKFAFVLTDTYFKDNFDNSAIPAMREVIDSLRTFGVQVSVVAPTSYQENYFNLYTRTGGKFININTKDYYKLMLEVADWVYDAINQVVLTHTLKSEGWESFDVSETIREYAYVYHYTIDVEVTNPNALTVSNVNVTLSLPDEIESLNKQISLGSIAPSEKKTATYEVTVKKLNQDQDLEYSATVTSDNTANITQYDRIFIEGFNEDNNIFVFGKDTWNFKNYGEKPESITNDYLNALIRNLPANYQQEIVLSAQEGQPGHCYGMSVSSILMKVNRLHPEILDSNADILYKVSKNDKARNLISYYQLSQMLPQIMADRIEFCIKSDKEKLSILKEVTDKVDEGGTPCVFSFSLINGKGKKEGHAVVAYSFEKGNFVKNGKKYDSRILIYDSNYPKWNENSCLYFNEGTDEWIIPNYNAVELTRCLNDINLMDISNIETTYKNYNSYLRSDYLTKLSISSSTKSWNIDTMKKNEYSDIVVMPNDGGNSSQIISFLDTALNNQAYTITPLDSEKGKSELCLMYDNYFMKANSDTWDSISFNPNDSNASVSIAGASGNFDITLTANEGHGSLEWPTIEVSGSDCKNTKLEKVSDGYLISGDSLNDITIKGQHILGESKEIVINTDEDSVLIGESKGELIASVDTDKDGVYEDLIANSDNKTEKAQLKDLDIENVILNPEFSSEITDYTATIENNVSSVKLIPTLNENTTATISVNGNSGTPLTSSVNLDLVTGENIIEIQVHGEKLLDTTYKIIINRLSGSEQTEPDKGEVSPPKTGDKFNILSTIVILATVSIGLLLTFQMKKRKRKV